MKLLTIIAMLFVTMASTVTAEPTCDEVLQKCDIAVSELQFQVKAGDELVNLLRVQRNEALKDSVSAEPMLPAIVWVLIGGAAGVLAMEFAR